MCIFLVANIELCTMFQSVDKDDKTYHHQQCIPGRYVVGNYMEETRFGFSEFYIGSVGTDVF